MINVIETAIITIIISFISGLLLEYYKDLAPRILCNVGNAVPLELNNKKIHAYILTVRNISNKTINKITLNVQGSQNALKIGDAKITKGLKFDSSIENNILDVSIPFLSKDDEFSVTLYVENKYGEYKKPVVTVRSPEKFKEINSIEKNGILSALFNMPRNINEIFFNKMKNNEKVVSNKNVDFTTVMDKAPNSIKTINKKNREISYGNRKVSKNKKAIAAIVSIVLVISIGIFGVFYLKGISTNAQISDTKTNAQNQSTDSTESASGTNKNAELKSSTSGTNKNASAKTSKNETTKNVDQKAPMNEMTKDTDTKTSTDETTGNTDTKTSTDETTKNSDAKTLTGGAAGSADAKNSTEGTTTNTDTKASTDTTTKTTDKKTSTEGITGNADTKASTGGTTGNTSN